MLGRKRKFLSALAAILGLGFTAVAYAAYALPGQVACALVEFSELKGVPGGIRFEQNISVPEGATLIDLQLQARARIENTFGAPRAQPIVVFFRDARSFWPLKLNAYGSTSFVGSRACVFIGPQGQSVDVVAHELMHAEVAKRVGYWRRNFELPAWFDEGVAMQVDLRSRYDWPRQKGDNDYSYIRQFTSQRQFWNADDKKLTRNYAAAKAEVAQWLAAIGRSELYSRLERVREGEGFDAVVVE